MSGYKRPPHFPTPDDIARAFKRQHSLPLHPPADWLNHTQALPPLPPNMNTVSFPASAHGLPQTAVPLLDPPLKQADFFSAAPPTLTPTQSAQLAASVACFPPPQAPPLNPAEAGPVSGIMVPFIYPPLPQLKPDTLCNPPGPQDAAEAGLLPPLPYPPPNYMPYPLIASHAPLSPQEVFSLWLNALENLPRVDMVVASAAGSIFDIQDQARAASLNITKLDEFVRLGLMAESDPEASDDRSSVALDSLDSSDNEVAEYYNNIDTTKVYDPYATPTPPNLLVVESAKKAEYCRVAPRTSKHGKITAPKEFLPPSPISELFSPQPHDRDIVVAETDVVNALGSYKEKRRAQLLELYQRLEDHFSENREEVYLEKKRQLLNKLKALQSTEVRYDVAPLDVEDPELRSYVAARNEQLARDMACLKVSQTYERIKAVLSFYQTSHKLYRTMNLVMINKLQKLRNFLHFQQQALAEAQGSDITSIRNRDSSKLYNGFVEQNYSSEIKEVFRAAVLKEDGLLEEDDAYEFQPSLFSAVYTNRQHTAAVHDFMPLVTRDEFRLVTGEAPSKTGPVKDSNKGGRHQIFQSLLYDLATSGSDTNASDSGLPVKRRPGRRAAPKPTYGEEVAKQNNDAALVAKIMKQFIGPAAASADELQADFDLIGIESRWPTK